MIYSLRKKLKAAVMLCAVFVSILSSSICAYAKENMTPAYEVKFLLDSSQVLNSDQLFKKTYRQIFETGSDYDTIGVLFLETKDRDFGDQGWINRIRVKEKANEFELTFKKRYSIENGNIDAALTQANGEGFDASDTNYKAEVDWGYSKMTLSLSCEKTKSNSGYDDLELPKKGDAVSIIEDKMPGKEADWLYEGWGKEYIKDASKVGPLNYLKYKGTYEGTDVAVEIWPVENQVTGNVAYITELSFKADSFDKASRVRSSLTGYLDELGILVHEDSLKTQTIMDAYLGN